MNPDWLENGLPIFSGGRDRGLARRMIDGLGGPTGFKTAYRTNADGSVTRVQLKGNMPPRIYTQSGGNDLVPADYTEVSLDLREYHADHVNYHLDNVQGKALRPYTLRYIKTVVFRNVRLGFRLPTLPLGRNKDYYSSAAISPSNIPAIVFTAFYPRVIDIMPVPDVFNGDSPMFEGSKTNPLIVDRTYFPEKVVRSCDGVFFTKYVPIRTLTLSNGVTFRFLNPTDRSFRW